MAKPKVKAVAETGDIDLSSPLSVVNDVEIGRAREARFLRDERDRVEARRAGRDPLPRRVLTAEERAEIAAMNREYVSPTRRVPAHGVRGWSASAPVANGALPSKPGSSAC